MQFKDLLENEKSKKFVTHLLASFYLPELIGVSWKSGHCCICKKEGIGIDKLHEHMPNMDNLTAQLIERCKLEVSDIPDEEKKEKIKESFNSPDAIKYRDTLLNRLICSNKSDKVICQDCHQAIRNYGDSRILSGDRAITRLLFDIRQNGGSERHTGREF